MKELSVIVNTHCPISYLIEGNGSLLYVFVRLFGLDRAQNTIVVHSALRN